MEAGSVQACEQSFAGLQEETERTELNSVPGFAWLVEYGQAIDPQDLPLSGHPATPEKT